MNADDLPEGEELWWAFTARAALAHARREDVWRFDEREQVLRYDAPDGTRLRIQRLYGSRFVLWGTTPGDPPQPNWSGVPGWASSDAVHRWFDKVGATFMAWHHRDGWDTATPAADLSRPVGPLLVDDLPPGLAGARPGPDLAAVLGDALDEDDDLDAALAVYTGAAASGPPTQGRVRTLLMAEVRAQMRLTAERDRILPSRPVLVVRWARVAAPAPGFRFGMHLAGDGLAPAPNNSEVADQFRVSLVNVFERLHREEADAHSGRWLFAQVRFDGVNVHFDRAFDSRPSWYRTEGPDLETLTAEMARRDPRWRPAWARLLPDPA